MNIAFIGGGNMATALITGLARGGRSAHTVTVCDPDPDARQRLVAMHGVTAHERIAAAVQHAEVVVLAVKPQVMDGVLRELAKQATLAPLVVSVAAGITTSTMARSLGQTVPIVRAMPNTPALLGAGITGLFAGQSCTTTHRRQAQDILATVGETVWVEDEALMDVVTALSGSGPAYFYLLVEAMREAGIRLGLPEATATQLAIRTAHGAGLMAVQDRADVAELRRRVTSPGGTTAAAISVLQAGGFQTLVATAIEAATQGGRELSGEAGPS